MGRIEDLKEKFSPLFDKWAVEATAIYRKLGGKEDITARVELSTWDELMCLYYVANENLPLLFQVDGRWLIECYPRWDAFVRVTMCDKAKFYSRKPKKNSYPSGMPRDAIPLVVATSAWLYRFFNDLQKLIRFIGEKTDCSFNYCLLYDGIVGLTHCFYSWKVTLSLTFRGRRLTLEVKTNQPKTGFSLSFLLPRQTAEFRQALDNLKNCFNLYEI